MQAAALQSFGSPVMTEERKRLLTELLKLRLIPIRKSLGSLQNTPLEHPDGDNKPTLPKPVPKPIR